MACFGLPPGSQGLVSIPVAIGMPPDIALDSVFPPEFPPGLLPALVVVGRSAGGQLLLVFGKLYLGTGQWGAHPSMPR